MFKIGDKVKTLICEDKDIKRFSIGTIGVIVKSNLNVPGCYCVSFDDKKWFYDEEELELIK